MNNIELNRIDRGVRMQYKTMGFPISLKENENRRVLIPRDLADIEVNSRLYFEEGYGSVLGIDDSEYIACGCNIATREDVLKKDIICDPKIGDAEYLDELQCKQTIFGWVHATQNREITDKLIKNQITAYAWEKMFYKGRHIFWENNVLAGEAGVLHAFQCYGKLPFHTKVAVLGSGNTARGAIKILNNLGAKVIQYNRRTEELLREEIGQYDVIVNCILWDVTRKDHIIYKEDLKRMKKNAMIIDISCDRNGGIETSVPTTIEKPTYIVDGILHYVVDHTPSIYHKTFTEQNSRIIYPYVKKLINRDIDETLQKSQIMYEGNIVDDEINIFQHR